MYDNHLLNLIDKHCGPITQILADNGAGHVHVMVMGTEVSMDRCPAGWCCVIGPEDWNDDGCTDNNPEVALVNGMTVYRKRLEDEYFRLATMWRNTPDPCEYDPNQPVPETLCPDRKILEAIRKRFVFTQVCGNAHDQATVRTADGGWLHVAVFKDGGWLASCSGHNVDGDSLEEVLDILEERLNK
jgi:hypothetical protein